MRTQQTSRKQMSDPTGTSSYQLSWWFPIFLQLCPFTIFRSYTCRSTCSSSAQTSSRKAANIPAFPLSSTGQENCSLPLRKCEELPKKRAEQPNKWNSKYAGTHGSHAQMEADSTWALTPTTRSPKSPSPEQPNTLCTLCVWDLALSSTSLQHPLLYRARAQKALTESSFHYQNSVVLANTNQLLTPFKRITKSGRDLFSHHMILKGTGTI